MTGIVYLRSILKKNHIKLPDDHNCILQEPIVCPAVHFRFFLVEIVDDLFHGNSKTLAPLEFAKEKFG